MSFTANGRIKSAQERTINVQANFAKLLNPEGDDHCRRLSGGGSPPCSPFALPFHPFYLKRRRQAA
jgi:hypothetical protein